MWRFLSGGRLIFLAPPVGSHPEYRCAQMEPVAPQATGVEQAQLIAAQETASQVGLSRSFLGRVSELNVVRSLQTMAAAMTEVAASPRRQPKQPAPLVHTLNILARDAGIGRVNTT